MSGESEPGESSHTYGFPNRVGHDRYIQNIIDHTDSTFSERDFQIPRFTPFSSHVAHEARLPNPLNEEQDDDDQNLDDFDLSVLGRPRQSPHVPSSDGQTRQRLSLPLNSTTNRQRVLGDASHHFRPFVSRDPEYRSPFPSNPIHADRLEPSPATQPLSGRDGSRRVGELQPGTQVFTPPFYNSSNPTPPLNSSHTGSSPSLTGRSSPSTRLSLKKQQTRVASRPPAAQPWSKRFHLDLDHAPSVPPVVNNTLLIDPRKALPDRYRAIFPYELFNAVQSKCFPLVYGTNDNVVISAPTGSGKTAVLEMAICKLASSKGGENFKIVYQAPTKSLCSERARDWEKKFAHMNLRCIELTGDTSHVQASRVGSASIIVTTPEKWDSITRKWSDHRKLLEMIRLVLIDEVHILKDVRGATLEAVVSRMKTIGANVRFVALSATVPNIEDIAKWLGHDHENQQESALFESFGEELRPVKLQRYVYGYDGAPNHFIFEKSLNGRLNLLLAKHSEGKPIMVFCFTRKSCENTARSLAEWWSACRADDKVWPAPTKRIAVVSEELQEIVRHGVAFHHAGLDTQDRAAVEQNFLSGQLRVICCTSTLAVGVNLPCHTVVIKGTVCYSDNGPTEYSDLEVMQMLGRAGRPQFDKSAVAIIMTRPPQVDRYNKMISGQELLESTLHQNLIEHLNSEIGLGTIQDMRTAKKWIGGTFLSVRIRQSPALYNLEDVHNAAGAEERMGEWCERDVKLLQQFGLITKELPLKCTEYGRAMSRYMVEFETMKLLLSISRGAKLDEMLTTICKATEFNEFRFKPAERALFRELNKSPFILYPIKETLTQTWHKISMVVQVHLGGAELPTGKEYGNIRLDMAREKKVIFDRFNRLVRCIVDCKACDADGVGTKVGLELARGIAANSWENRPTQLSQIPGFGPVAVRKWISHGVNTVLGVADKSFLDIERIASRLPPFGKGLLTTLEDFPRLILRADLVESVTQHSRPEAGVSVTLKVKLGHSNTKSAPNWKGKVPALTLLVLTTDGNLAYFWRGNIKKIDKTTGLELTFPVALSGPKQTISCHFSCEEIVGTQVSKTLEPKIPASVFRNVQTQSSQRKIPEVNLLDDDFDDDLDYDLDYGDVADQDMLDALDSSIQIDPRGLPDRPDQLDDVEDDGDFPLIDDLLSQEDPHSTAEPAKMENGRWMCNHPCRNRGRTRSGKPCIHKCCHEGLPKPRRRPQKKEVPQINDEEDEDFSAREQSMLPSQPHEHTHDVNRGKGSKSHSATRSSGHSGGYGATSTVLGGSRAGRPSSKRMNPNDRSDGLEKTTTSKKAKLKEKPLDLESLSDIECIDLSGAGEAAQDHSDLTRKPVSSTEKGRRKLLDLHGKVQGDAGTPSRLTKSYRSTVTGSETGQPYEIRHGRAEDTPIPNDENLDVFDDEEDDAYLPDVDELLSYNVSSDVGAHETNWGDETLYPSVVQTFKNSVESGVASNLSFTTVNELQKASQRFELPPAGDTINGTMPQSSSSVTGLPLPHIQGSSSPLPAIDMSPRQYLTPERFLEASPSLPIESHPSASVESTLPQQDEHAEHASPPTLRPDEPAWLADFDPEFIESLRGCVNFVD